jgi:hypothetical protein
LPPSEQPFAPSQDSMSAALAQFRKYLWVMAGECALAANQ